MVQDLRAMFEFLTTTSMGIVCLYLSSMFLGYIAAYKIPKLIFSIFFLTFTELFFLLAYIFLMKMRHHDDLHSANGSLWVFLGSFWGAFIFFMIFYFMRFGIIASLPRLFIRRFGSISDGKIVRIEDSGMSYGSGSGVTKFQANLNAELNRRSIKTVTIQYQGPLGENKEARINLLPYQADKILGKQDLKIKTHSLFSNSAIILNNS